VAECEERRLINESGSSNFSLEGRDLGCARENPPLNVCCGGASHVD
jgi:hypothetical protein